ncbi:hypothetical protein C8J57DRAFT_1310905 [Mycena rebaudengoi]|nr:hypothetical protein C8J57DRAFT_1310905 [Mycena rebaudengoi]
MLCRRTGPLPNLKKLWIRPRGNQAVIVEALLRLCPALEELTIYWCYDFLYVRDDPVLLNPHPDALPLLKFYEGPDDAESINAFMRGCPVRHLAVPGSQARLNGPYLLYNLDGIEERAKIVSLELRLHALNKDFLKSVCALFPNIRAVGIWAKDFVPSGSRTADVGAADHPRRAAAAGP